MNQFSKTLKRSKLIGLETFGFILRPLHTSLVSFLIIRYHDISLWGSFVVFLIGVELLTTLLNWGQKPYLLREFSLHPSTIGQQWSKASYARIPLFLFAIITIVIVPSFREYFIPLSIWVFFKWCGFLFEPIIQYHRKYGWSIAAELVALAVAAFTIMFVAEEIELPTLLFVFALSSGAKSLVLLPLLKEWEASTFSINSVKKELAISFPFFALSIAGLLQTKSDLYVASYLLNSKALASYQVILSFLLLGQTVSAMILGPFQKNIYRWQGDDIRQLKNFYLKVGFLLTLVFSLGLYFVLRYIYLIDFSLWFMPLFFAYLFPLYTYFIESQILLKFKHEKQLLYFNLVTAVCNIVFSIFLINLFGIEGALLSGIISRLVLSKLIVNKSKAIRRNDH